MRTLFILKPDAYERNLDGEIKMLLQQHFKLEEQGKICFTPEAVSEFYSHLKDRPQVIQVLQQFLVQRPVEYLVMSGDNIIQHGRNLVGATDPAQASHSSIRGRYSDGSGNKTRNLIHASDSPESFAREYAIVQSLKCS